MNSELARLAKQTDHGEGGDDVKKRRDELTKKIDGLTTGTGEGKGGENVEPPPKGTVHEKCMTFLNSYLPLLKGLDAAFSSFEERALSGGNGDITGKTQNTNLFNLREALCLSFLVSFRTVFKHFNSNS